VIKINIKAPIFQELFNGGAPGCLWNRRAEFDEALPIKIQKKDDKRPNIKIGGLKQVCQMWES
jgi:hypothetical protein